ncbi:MAG: hypothetical protein L6V93_10685 [Clostridiales bacterium]|nr:MAG: hypothetical protein L6V93_10685 [Clostridiales bacterium]
MSLQAQKYYSADTRHNISVTYTNGDETFTAAADTAWTSSDGESGVIPKNDYHNQPYYPNPSFYGKYQNGIGKKTKAITQKNRNIYGHND